MFKRSCYFLLIVEILLGVAHLLWPEYRWGQGRRSYFNFDNSLTFASWLASMQFVIIAILSFFGFHKSKRKSISSSVFWMFIAFGALIFSLFEITRLPTRLDIFDYRIENIYGKFAIFSSWLIFLCVFGFFLIDKFKNSVESF